jgi:hypothetical protein
MLRRAVLKIIHTLATNVFTLLEVLGIPRVPGGGRGEGEGVG